MTRPCGIFFGSTRSRRFLAFSVKADSNLSVLTRNLKLNFAMIRLLQTFLDEDWTMALGDPLDQCCPTEIECELHFPL